MSWIRESTLTWFQLLAVKILRSGHIPKHVAFIMDGNRRYAKKKNVEKIAGHSSGFNKLADTLQWCIDLGISEVTVYAFSIENFRRDKKEVDALFELAKEKFETLLNERDKLMEYGICVRVIGNISLLPDDLVKLIAEAMIVTRFNKRAYLNLAFAYTSRDEITHAVKDIIEGVKNADILPEDITEDLISKCMYTYKSPNPDLLIRTSGELRFSDFLMWQTTDTCIYFVDALWPEFSIWDFLSAIFRYQRCYPELKKGIDTQNVIHNARVTKYVNKLYHDRQCMLEKIHLTMPHS